MKQVPEAGRRRVRFMREVHAAWTPYRAGEVVELPEAKAEQFILDGLAVPEGWALPEARVRRLRDEREVRRLYSIAALPTCATPELILAQAAEIERRLGQAVTVLPGGLRKVNEESQRRRPLILR